MERKGILVCHNKRTFIRGVEAAVKGFPAEVRSQVYIESVTTVDKLFRLVQTPEQYLAIFLGDHLSDGKPTLPFLKALKKGAFPHLSNTHLYIISSFKNFLIAQDKVLRSAVPGVLLSRQELEKERIPQAIEELIKRP